MKTKKLNVGLYETTINGVTYQIKHYTIERGYVSNFWTWMREGETGADPFSTKKEAVAALTGAANA